MPQSNSPKRKEVILRAASSYQDAEQIAALGSHVFATTFGYSMPASDLSAYLESTYNVKSILSDVSNPNMDTIVACTSSDVNHVVGFAQLNRATTEPCLEGAEEPIELQRLYVSQDFHGSGVGRLLVERAEELARKAEFKTLWLGVWEENFKAHKVYERFGFMKVGEHDFKMGTCIQTDWILSKKL